jgi:hypothetical protein
MAASVVRSAGLIAGLAAALFTRGVRLGRSGRRFQSPQDRERAARRH